VVTRLAWLTSLALALNGSDLVSQSQVNFSGVWVSQGASGFALLRYLPRKLSRPDGVGDAQRTPGYTLLIQHADGRVRVEFPGASNNVLTRPAFVLDATPHTIVEDRGAFWTKYVMRADWTGDALTLRSTSYSGWPATDPATARGNDSQYETEYVLSLDASRTVLTMTITGADEKFEAAFRQRFSRAP
jgi:hypothetical protein